MKVSVITACLNSADTIESTVESVLGQDYPEIEYIVVDGRSTDGTLDILERFRGRIQKLVSERDSGIYDALNKGIGLATGDIIAFLHADDTYAGSTVIRQVVETFSRQDCDCVYGDLQYVSRADDSRVVRTWRAGVYEAGCFTKGWMPPHPAFFAKASAYRIHGAYDTSFRCSGDYELMLRFLHVKRLRVAYIPVVLVRMRTGGLSNASFKSRLRANREDRKAWKVNGIRPGLLTLVRKPLSKLRQFAVR